MNERVHGPVEVPALRIGRTDVGAATALVEDDALTLSVRVEGAERTLRIRFTAIDSIHSTSEELELVVRDGTRVTIAAPAGSSFSDELLGRCRTLPELTRTLRAFGSRRARPGAPNSARDTGDSEQQRFFAPLLDARRAAASVEGSNAITSFNGSSLMLALEQTLKQFAVDRHADAGPARRALEAELVDASEPLFDALRALREAANAAGESTDDLRLWRAWSSQLRATFETADRVWIAIDAVLDSAPVAPPVPQTARPR
jgi:hypothetical protein